MPYIKRTDGLGATIAGRGCSTVSAMPDGSVTVAEVESVRAGDVEIAKSEFDSLIAQIIVAPKPAVAAPAPTLASVLVSELPKVRADSALGATAKAALDAIVEAAKKA